MCIYTLTYPSERAAPNPAPTHDGQCRAGLPPILPRDKKGRQLESTVTFEAVWYFPLMVSVVFIYLIREKGGVIEREERDNTGVSNHLLNSLVSTISQFKTTNSDAPVVEDTFMLP